MSVLILEDSPTRIKLFRQGFIGASTTVLNKASMAISWLKECTPRLICLDYDLDQYGEELKNSGTGFEVAAFIAKNTKRFTRTLIIIHSLNETGANKMLRLLKINKLSASRHPKLWESQPDMERLAHAVREMDNKP
jgi:CheY-like chemotaxis protein